MRILISWALNALTLLGISMWIAPRLPILQGFHVEGFEAAAVAVAILAVLNLTVRPIIKLFALPITCLTFGLFALVINALMMLLTSQFVTGFTVGGFRNALIASIMYSIISAILNGVFNKKEKDDD